MKKLVNNLDTLKSVCETLSKEPRISLDTETTGLHPFHGDRLFSIVIGTSQSEYYFDFNIGGLRKSPEVYGHIQRVLDAVAYVFMINADFDCSMLHMEGLEVKGKILDGGVMARLDYSLHTPQGSKSENQFFSMDYLAKYYLGLKKDTTVETYIKENNLYGLDKDGKSKKLYSKVPLDIMFPYGCNDARITYDVCTKILEHINAKDHKFKESRPKSWPPIMSKLADESALTKSLTSMKLRGMLLNKQFCEEAMEYELKNSETKLKQIKEEVDLNINSPKQVQNYLRGTLGLELPKIIKRGKWTGGYSTAAETLFSLAETHDLPVLTDIVSAKRSQKKANTYYKNYLKMIDANGVIHCGLGQETTVTGRLSSFAPNLQNVPKEDYHKWAVRNSFKARPGRKLFMLDYKGQEMYIMIDLSGDLDVIEQVATGTDIYIAMASMVKNIAGVEITRSQAKALALGVAYGQGAALIAAKLKCSIEEAKKLRTAFKKSLSGVNKLDLWCKTQAKKYGKIHNPYGRVSFIEKGFEYKALNALIQGTAADCTKRGIISCQNYLQNYQSELLLTVHDELIFEVVPEEEKEILPQLTELMSKAYPHRHLPLRVDVESSETTWAAKSLYSE